MTNSTKPRPIRHHHARKIKKPNHRAPICVIGLGAILGAFPAMAHNYEPVINNYYDAGQASGVSGDDLAEATAKAAACDHSFYFGTNRPQLSIQGAYFDGQSELCIGAAWRPESSDVMLNISVSPDEDTDLMLFQGGALILF